MKLHAHRHTRVNGEAQISTGGMMLVALIRFRSKIIASTKGEEEEKAEPGAFWAGLGPGT
jgi:hypothetical protein